MHLNGGDRHAERIAKYPREDAKKAAVLRKGLARERISQPATVNGVHLYFDR